MLYGNIYHQYTPNVSMYIPYMDPMGYGWSVSTGIEWDFHQSAMSNSEPGSQKLLHGGHGSVPRIRSVVALSHSTSW